MIFKFSLMFVAFFYGLLLGQKPMFNKPYSPRIANYKISVELDPETHMLQGSQILNWRNDSQDTINDLHFHLYLNAFKNEMSTLMKEATNRQSRFTNDEGWGWIEIESMIINDQEMKDRFEFVQPDDENSDDQTVLRIPLNQPIKPHEVTIIEIKFLAKLPQLFVRTGYHGEFYMVGQWFPKIGVYEETGERYETTGNWNCHQFHINSEFFADYGVYEVTIIVPENYIVGATGVLIDEEHLNESKKSVTYYCEDVHDFAWTADPNYIIVEDQWRDVNIRFLAHPGHETQADRHIGSAKIALRYFNDHLGKYPYPTLTIVDPAYGGSEAGGMEYPTLITTGTFWMLPDGIRLPETETIHEFGHNYWYGIIGSNEFEEAWLDEGINTYWELKIMEKYYDTEKGSLVSLFGLNIDDTETQWRSYQFRPKRDAIFNLSWKYGQGGYGSFSYAKPALMLMTLDNYLGEELMNKIMLTYYDRFRFKHPTSRDFINAVNDVTGQDFNWFFDQVLYGTNVLDYKVANISSRKVNQNPLGIFGNPLEEVKGYSTMERDSDEDSSSVKKTLYTNKIIIAREGEVTFPVEILIRFEGGEEKKENWEGKDRYIIYEYQSENKVISAEVDPERKIWLDINFLNNGKTTNENKAATLKYTSRWLFWMQNLLHYMTIFG